MRWTDILLCKDKRKIKRIYYESFPSKERMPWAMMLFLSMLPTTKFKAIYDDEKLCGFIYFGVLGKHVFVMFFAVDSEMRNCGYGSKILSELKERYPKKMIVVTIEPTVNNPLDIRDRRKQFILEITLRKLDALLSHSVICKRYLSVEEHLTERPFQCSFFHTVFLQFGPDMIKKVILTKG